MTDIYITETDTEIRAEAHGHSESRIKELIEAIREQNDEK